MKTTDCASRNCCAWGVILISEWMQALTHDNNDYGDSLQITKLFSFFTEWFKIHTALICFYYIYFVLWLSERHLLILESKPSSREGEEEKNGIVLYSCIRHIYFSIFQSSKTPRLIINNPTYQDVGALTWNKVCKVPSREPDSYLAFWYEYGENW